MLPLVPRFRHNLRRFLLSRKTYYFGQKIRVPLFAKSLIGSDLRLP